MRDTWAQAIADLQPHGIIYMIDGRKDDESIRTDVRDIRKFVLCNYSAGPGPLATIHVFINFADHWAHTTTEQRRRVRLARNELDDVTVGSIELAGLRMGAASTQLSPHKKGWEEVDRALHHFGADLAG